MKVPRTLIEVARAIARGDARVAGWVRASPALARQALDTGATRASSVDFFLVEIAHHVYGGDTLLHVAAASYATGLAKVLLDAGADVRARNRRGAEPLHYAADGGPQLQTWAPDEQANTVALLIAAGADPNARDKNGVTPLHCAVRARCTGAVRALLAGGADAGLPNKSGTRLLDLARMTTGRGGSGTAEAKREQAAILALLSARPRSR